MPPDPYDTLPEISLSAPKGKTQRADDPLAGLNLDEIPLSLAQTPLVDYPASVSGDEGVAISTRVPTAWLDSIDRIRETVGTKLPDMWPKKANFFRWCVALGIQRLALTQRALDSGEVELDAILSTRVFLEQEGGKITARADTVNHSRTQAAVIGQAMTQLITTGDESEAANIVNEWINGAQQQQSGFWKDYLLKILVVTPEIADPLKTLILGSFVTDEVVTDLAIKTGLVSAKILRPEENSYADRE